jgi:hypothetical protein
MGQYYRGVVLGKTTKKAKKLIVKEAFCPYTHENGAKLMEHSYVGNWYVKEYERVLAGEFYGYPFVWAGDYADLIYGALAYEEAAHFNHQRMLRRIKKAGYKYDPNKWGYECTKYAKNGTISASKSEKEFSEKTPYEELENITYEFILNFDKKQFVKIPKKSNEKDKYGYTKLTIHPLPLLCADGNGRGGGDYWESNSDFDKVGIWAYDRIGIDNEIPEGFTELVVNFVEKY